MTFPKPTPLLRYFEHDHLQGDAREVCARFHGLAWECELNLPDGPEKTVALRKLLEAKDAAVRSVVARPVEHPAVGIPGWGLAVGQAPPEQPAGDTGDTGDGDEGDDEDDDEE